MQLRQIFLNMRLRAPIKSNCDTSMKDKDILQRFLFDTISVRGEIVRLEESFQTIMQQHQYPAPIQKVLGEMLVVASLLSASIKFKGRVSVQFQGKDQLKLLLAQSDHELQVRGIAQWEGELSQADLIQQLKAGIIAITMEPEGNAENRYQGIVAWQGNSLAQSIEGYFTRSEQIPTRLWLAVDEKRAAGFLIQVMPRESARKARGVEGEHDWEHICHLTQTLTDSELLNLENAELLYRLYVEEQVRLFPSLPVNFCCTCSVERSENALRMVGEDEVNAELYEKQQIVVTCEFCNKSYPFDRVDIARIFKQGDVGSSTQLH
jgi:molecular chaperone Hsp33